jgi:hypothetical protein
MSERPWFRAAQPFNRPRIRRAALLFGLAWALPSLLALSACSERRGEGGAEPPRSAMPAWMSVFKPASGPVTEPPNPLWPPMDRAADPAGAWPTIQTASGPGLARAPFPPRTASGAVPGRGAEHGPADPAGEAGAVAQDREASGSASATGASAQGEGRPMRPGGPGGPGGPGRPPMGGASGPGMGMPPRGEPPPGPPGVTTPPPVDTTVTPPAPLRAGQRPIVSLKAGVIEAARASAAQP